MSTKEAAIDLIRRLPDNVSLSEILGHLRRQFGFQAEEWPADELTDDEWRRFVFHGLRNELADEREDIYTEEDGEPVDGQG
jgi:hypothetical protein